jgi:hypothetical protein
MSYSPVIYLDATNTLSTSSSSWKNLGSLGGTVNMSYMGSFDSNDNGGSYYFGSFLQTNQTQHGSLVTSSTQNFTSITIAAVVKRNHQGSGSWNTIWAAPDNELLFGTIGDILYLYHPTNINTGYKLTLDVWYFVAVTITTGGLYTFYVNGVSVYSGTHSTLNVSSQVFGIGCGYSGGAGTTSVISANEQFYGKISAIAVYNRALTGSEISNLCSQLPVSSSIIRSVDYGNTFSDISGTQFDTTTTYWNAIASTHSADMQVAVAYGGSIYRSTNYGATWSNSGITVDGGANSARNWQDIAVSGETGSIQIACGPGGYLYVSSGSSGTVWSSSVTFNGTLQSTFGTNTWKALAISANGQYGLACANPGFIYRSGNSCSAWTSTDISLNGGIQNSNRLWQDVGMSANGKYQVACVGGTGTPGNIYYSKNYGQTWFVLPDPSGNRQWSSVTISENGSTISATTNDASGGIWNYTMPDDQYYTPGLLTNTGSTTASTVRAIAYGNNGTGSSLDGYWLAGSDASANTLAYSTNGMDWTAVVGSKTTLFNAVNGVAYGENIDGTPMWVAVGSPFVGSVHGITAYSIAYSYNMTTWTGVRNSTNFTGQANHVAYGKDEFGQGIWVAVGQSDGTLTSNLGNSASYNSSGTVNTTIFYSYDGANWAAATGTGIFSTSGTDVAWGIDASGVATWVATGVGYTNQITGVFIPGGQIAYSTNGKVWTPIQTQVSTGLSATTLSATTRGSAIIPPPTSTGMITPVYSNIWKMLGGDIYGDRKDDQSGYSVSISSDGTVVAIGARYADTNFTGNNNRGHVRVYKYNPTKNLPQMNENLPGFGPAGWDRLGGDIDGKSDSDFIGTSVALSADGTTLVVGATQNDGVTGTQSEIGMVRVYRYRADKTAPQFGNTSATATDFGPAGWDRLGGDIDGEVADDESGWSVSLSGNGTRVAIGATRNDGDDKTDSGHVRVYEYKKDSLDNIWKWMQLGADINGEAEGDYSGFSVIMSADGTRVAIGAPFGSSGHVRVYQLPAPAPEPSPSPSPLNVIVNLGIAVDASGTINVFGQVAPTVANVIVADVELPAAALYSASNSMFEFWEPSTARGTRLAQLATSDSRNWKLLTRKLANGIQDCLEGEFDATLATPFSNAKYTEAVHKKAANFGELALRSYAHYTLGHIDATAAITNDVAFVRAMLSQDASGVYTKSTEGVEDDFSATAAGTKSDANLAKLLVKAIAIKDGAGALLIAEQVLGQDASRAMDEDNNELTVDKKQALKFIAGDIIYMNIKLQKPDVVVGSGQKVGDSSVEDKFAVEENYTLKITLS